MHQHLWSIYKPFTILLHTWLFSMYLLGSNEPFKFSDAAYDVGCKLFAEFLMLESKQYVLEHCRLSDKRNIVQIDPHSVNSFLQWFILLFLMMPDRTLSNLRLLTASCGQICQSLTSNCSTVGSNT